MLAARATARRFARPTRQFATVVDNAGLKVAAFDYGQPTSAITVLLKAGSRYESKPGVAHFLKNFAFRVCEIIRIWGRTDVGDSTEHRQPLYSWNSEGGGIAWGTPLFELGQGASRIHSRVHEG